uniref:Metalloendopeptidase n=1 Tax=Steinernema glaseri TaxID=37863 RepID=A0A1I7YC83_9BILA
MRFLVAILLAVLTASATITKRAAINRDNFPERLWPTDKPIPYRFSSDFSDISDMRDVMETIASWTCLSFKDVTTESDVKEANGSIQSTIVFVNSTECTTERISTASNTATVYISLAEATCRMPYVFYRVMLRTLGMEYTHVRPDRDEYISVHEEDIKPENLEEFRKVSGFKVSTYGVPYDFDSLMHISPEVYEKTEGIPTMVAKDPLHQPGMGLNFGVPSHSDYLLLNRLYRCLDRCAGLETNCEYGGFPNPNNCTSCICPWGFAGQSCNEMDGCGESVSSTTSWQRFSVKSTNEAPLCFWFLTAPPGRKIEIQLEKIVPDDPLCQYQPYTWLEVRLGNFVVGGYKFFCNAHIPNHTLISEGNLAVLSAQHIDVPIEVELSFRNVEATSFRNVEATSKSTGSIFGLSVVIGVCSLLLL